MAALTEPKSVQEMASAFSQRTESFGGGVLASSVVFYPGAIVCFDTSDQTIKPASVATTLIPLGRYENDEVVDTSDADAAEKIMVRCGIFKLENSSGGGIINNEDAGSDCYLADDQTVTIVSTGASAAGKVVSVESDGVYVAINPFV